MGPWFSVAGGRLLGTRTPQPAKLLSANNSKTPRVHPIFSHGYTPGLPRLLLPKAGSWPGLSWRPTTHCTSSHRSLGPLSFGVWERYFPSPPHTHLLSSLVDIFPHHELRHQLGGPPASGRRTLHLPNRDRAQAAERLRECRENVPGTERSKRPIDTTPASIDNGEQHLLVQSESLFYAAQPTGNVGVGRRVVIDSPQATQEQPRRAEPARAHMRRGQLPGWDARAEWGRPIWRRPRDAELHFSPLRYDPTQGWRGQRIEGAEMSQLHSI